MSEVNGTRSRARRAVVSVLAGGGLTVVGLGGPLTGVALAAEATSEPTTSTETSTTTTPAPETPAQTTTTSTSTATTTTPPPATTATPVSEPPATTTTSATPVTTPAPSSSGAAKSKPTPTGGPKVVIQRTQQTTEAPEPVPAASSTQAKTPANGAPTSSTDIAPAPQLAAAQSQALAELMAGSSASAQALGFYRIPLFLLPIYQAAAVQYGVPWPVLAAINEVETNFGTDLSVSTAGAVGWMQFMPETWLQYGVDAVNAGYADPYNPVDAIFAAARYLHAAGASNNLRTAILAYNHSEAYVESVLLRARLFASYPASVIATLTGLTEGSMPVSGAQLSASSNIPLGSVAPTPATASSATAGATLTQPAAAEARAASAKHALPGSTPAPSPAVSAARAERALNAASPPSQLSDLVARRDAPVVAVEDGRVVGLGESRKLGRYLVLRDTYGDVFTYAGLGSVAPAFRLPKPVVVQIPKGALQSEESASDPAPKRAATAGRQPLTLHVAKRKAAKASRRVRASASTADASGEPEATAGGGKVRVFAHPDNPDAIAAARVRARKQEAGTHGWMKLTRGSVVAQGTVIGHLGSDGESPDATLRFAIRPAGAQSAIDPRPIFTNWRQLAVALHPQGAKDGPVLAGATASDAFLLSRTELQRAVLADPDIKLGRCDRDQVAAGKVGRQALALLVFLSRSGLKPTVGELSCGRAVYTARGAVTTYPAADTVDIAAINGIPVAGHQGAGTITDITIRTLLTIQPQFAPKRIVSLMKYPGAPSTIAAADYAAYIKVELAGKPHTATASDAPGSSRASAARANTASTLASSDMVLNTTEWQQLVEQIGNLQPAKLSHKPSVSAIRDGQAAPGNRGLGTRALP